MTREEAAIKSCEDRIKHLESAPTHHYGKRQRERAIELEKVKIKALRPVSREQVEKMQGEWNYSHTTEIDHFTVVKCSKCGHKAFAMAIHVKDGNFCPHCGAPMTDEAVEMVMKRMEAVKDATD